MQFIFLALILFAVSSCAPEPKNKNRYQNFEQLRASGYDKELKTALKNVMSQDEKVLPAVKCPRDLIQTLNFRSGMECGAIRVPQDHNNPKQSKQMAVGYFKYPRNFDPKKPLLVIEQGGPGGSSMALTAYFMSELSRLSENFNLLAVEQRGTPWTYPYFLCDPVSGLDENGEPLDYDQYEENRLLSEQFCLQQANLSMDLRRISSHQIAQDIVYTAAEFGFDEFNFYGGSYGTVVGQYLLELFPDNLKNVILDSPVVVGRHWTADSIRFEDQLFKIRFEQFASKNFPGTDFESALEILLTQAESLRLQPLELEIKYPSHEAVITLDRDYFFYLFVVQLLDSKPSDDADEMYQALKLLDSDINEAKVNFKRIIEALFNRGQTSANRPSEFLYRQLIVCREFYFDPLNVVKAVESWKFLPKVLSEAELDYRKSTTSICTLDLSKIDNDLVLLQPVTTEKSVLVVGGSEDVTTVPQNVQDLAVNMPMAHKEVFEGIGHGVFARVDCISDSMINYLMSPDGSYENLCN